MMLTMMKRAGMLMMNCKFVEQNKSIFGEKPDRVPRVTLFCLDLGTFRFFFHRIFSIKKVDPIVVL